MVSLRAFIWGEDYEKCECYSIEICLEESGDNRLFVLWVGCGSFGIFSILYSKDQ